MDEPTGDLDTKNTLEIMDLLLTFNQIGKKTLVMVTHNDDLECYADRILYVSDGQFVKQAINQQQVSLDYDKYVQHLKKKNARSLVMHYVIALESSSFQSSAICTAQKMWYDMSRGCKLNCQLV